MAAAFNISDRKRAKLIAEEQARIAEYQRAEAERLLHEFTVKLANGLPLLWSPLLNAALIAGRPWMHVHCPGCNTVKAIDLRVVPRSPMTALTAIAERLRCKRCQRQAAAPKIVKLTAAHDG